MSEPRPQTFEKDGVTVTTALPAEKVALQSAGFAPATKKDAAPAKAAPSKS